MSSTSPTYAFQLASPALSGLGESPLWSVQEQCLYYVDIAEKQVLRLHPDSGALQRWQLQQEPGCIALIEGGGLLVAQRDGLWRLDLSTGDLRQVAQAPYDPARQRFNDGRVDAAGRFWVGTLDDAREPNAQLYRFEAGRFESMAGGIANSNGLAWSPEQRRLYWADTKGHRVWSYEFDLAQGRLGDRELFAAFEPRLAGQALDAYQGRPDGAAVDVEGCYWVAMYEGQRLLRLSPTGQLLTTLKLPVRCPTMPCFGGPDLRTLYITTARQGRPPDELEVQPLAGAVMQLRVDVPGLAPNRVRL
ncbi:SMP-30/gluconolactonase/LRE family protein [Roseateles sp.]|jgi:sugar lactone lactonase YvrE|uniref:SMP-30/gluconolactonase/LRE family protein n=1 Tax=Roseateles sp. TaxID=1971397 RepID=UPI0037C9E3E7